MEPVGEYQKLQVKQFPVRSQKGSTEGKYWRRFARPAVIPQIGIVSHVSFNADVPPDFAVTSSTRVLIYDGISHSVKRTLSRFPDTALCGSFRSDGRLLAAGCVSGLVQVFDISSRAVLRQFKVHKRATHVSHFTVDRTHVLSASDDTTVRLWDLAQGEQVSRFDGHQDYVRSAACVSDVVWATGGYDHAIKLWDTRVPEAVMTLDHGAPVEGVAAVGTAGHLVASAGGTAAALWDITGGGRCVARLKNHQKTVTSVQAVAVADSSGLVSQRLVTGSLDGHVKVYDLLTFRTAYAFKYPAPVTAVAVSPQLDAMVVGLADRSMVVRRHKGESQTLTVPGGYQKRPSKRLRSYAPRLTASSYKFFLRGAGAKAAQADCLVNARKRTKLREYDHMLKQFRYSDAVDAALKTGRPEVIAAVIDELIIRNGMTSAVDKRSPEMLLPLLQHVCKYIAHPDHARMCLQVANLIIDLHAEALACDRDVAKVVHDLRGRLGAEAKVQQEMHALQGMVEMLLQSQR